MLLGLLAGRGGRQQHGLLVEVGDHRAGGLLGEPTGIESDGAGAEAPVVDGGGCFVDALVDLSDRHVSLGPFFVRLFVAMRGSGEQPERHRPEYGYGRRSKRPDGTRPAATTEDRPIAGWPLS